MRGVAALENVGTKVNAANKNTGNNALRTSGQASRPLLDVESADGYRLLGGC
jgi:hypothetical protein